MMEAPLVSIIVPIYNTEEYLRECLDSLEVGNNNCFEIILINDGSTDSSLNICYDYEKNNHNIGSAQFLIQPNT